MSRQIGKQEQRLEFCSYGDIKKDNPAGNE